MKSTLIGVLTGAFLATSALAHPGLSVGLDTGYFDGEMSSYYHDDYQNTTYANVNKNAASAWYIGPIVQYKTTLCDVGIPCDLGFGKLAGDLHARYLFAFGDGSTTTTQYDTITRKLGDQASFGLGLELREIGGLPISLGIDGDWSSLSASNKDKYNGDSVSFYRQHANGPSWGPHIAWDVTPNWTLEGRVTFVSASSTNNHGSYPGDTWSQNDTIRGTGYWFGLRHEL
jgi:hypothetical protein